MDAGIVHPHQLTWPPRDASMTILRLTYLMVDSDPSLLVYRAIPAPAGYAIDHANKSLLDKWATGIPK